MARVPYVDLKEDAINIRRVLANCPQGEKRNRDFALYIRHESKLDAKLRELAILQVGYAARCAYEYAHHVAIAREFGVTDDEIRALADETAGRTTSLDHLSQLVLKAAREMTDGTAISDSTWNGLKQHLSNEHLVDLVLAIAYYNAVVRILDSLKVDVEPAYQTYLLEFPLPQ